MSMRLLGTFRLLMKLKWGEMARIPSLWKIVSRIFMKKIVPKLESDHGLML